MYFETYNFSGGVAYGMYMYSQAGYNNKYTFYCNISYNVYIHIYMNALLPSNICINLQNNNIFEYL